MKYGLYFAGECEAWTVELRDRIEGWAPPRGGGVDRQGGGGGRLTASLPETISRVAFAKF